MYDQLVTIPRPPFKDFRRSTRVPLDVSLEVQGETGTHKGVTVVVNLHGALIRIVKPIALGAHIRVTVYITSKSAKARVVYISNENPLTCGIELDEPQNIWGVSLAPDDWEDNSTPSSWQ